VFVLLAGSLLFLFKNMKDSIAILFFALICCSSFAVHLVESKVQLPVPYRPNFKLVTPCSVATRGPYSMSYAFQANITWTVANTTLLNQVSEWEASVTSDMERDAISWSVRVPASARSWQNLWFYVPVGTCSPTTTYFYLRVRARRSNGQVGPWSTAREIKGIMAPRRTRKLIVAKGPNGRVTFDIE